MHPQRAGYADSVERVTAVLRREGIDGESIRAAEILPERSAGTGWLVVLPDRRVRCVRLNRRRAGDSHLT